MPAYEALYRKWRPQTFGDIVAQPHITKTLQNQIMREKTAHAYLFTGSRGTGKTTCARIFAKAVNCLHPKDGSPCLECEICRDAEAGTLTDIIEIDGASNNGVDEVRNLRDNAAYMPVRCKYKIYIIDEVHMMSAGAFNALLKMIEEPPPYVKFVFATTEIHKVPATILSRCQRFDFRRILPADIASRIRYIADHESFSISEGAARRIAVLADGGMRDALSLLDQCAAVSDRIEQETVEEAVGVAGTESVFEILRAIAKKDATAALGRIDRLYQQSKDMTRFADEISQQLRNLMLLKTAPDDPALLSCMPDELETLRGLAEQFSMEAVLSALSDVRQCCDRMVRAGNRRMELEMTVIRLCAERASAVPQQTTAPNILQDQVSMLTGQIQSLEQQLAQLQGQLQDLQNTPSAPGVPRRRLRQNDDDSQKPRAFEEQEDIPDLKGYVPLKNWASVLECLYELNKAVAAPLDNSNAYVHEEKGALYIRVRNPFFQDVCNALPETKNLIKQAAMQTLGRIYQLSFRCLVAQENSSAPINVIVQRAREYNIPVTPLREKKPD